MMSSKLSRSMTFIGVSALLLGVLGVRLFPHRQEVYPGACWEKRSPEAVGLSRARLDVFRDFVGGRGCVVRHGYMVYTYGEVSRRADVASAAKPFYAHFLLKAVEDGRIPSLDEKVVRWEPRLNEINKDLSYKDRDITWRHLANQISCYGVVEKPGTAFCYNDWQMALFWDTLFLKVYGATCENVDEKVLRQLLTEPLQCEDDPTFMAAAVFAQGKLAGQAPPQRPARHDGGDQSTSQLPPARWAKGGGDDHRSTFDRVAGYPGQPDRPLR